MYKIHKSSDKEPRAFIHQNKIHGTKTIHITDDGERILCTLNLESQIAGWEKWLDESQMNAFIDDLLMLQEYKAAYLEQNSAAKTLLDKTPQQQFEAWAKKDYLIWSPAVGYKSSKIIFDSWIAENKFFDTNGREWLAYGHGFPETTNGEWIKEVDGASEFEAWAKDKKIRWVHKDGEAAEAIRFKYWDCDNSFRDTNHEQWWAFGHGLPEDPNGGYWEDVT